MFEESMILKKYNLKASKKPGKKADGCVILCIQPLQFSYIHNSQPGINNTISCAFQQPFTFSPFISLNKKE
jgi:hypothetical protein